RVDLRPELGDTGEAVTAWGGIVPGAETYTIVYTGVSETTFSVAAHPRPVILATSPAIPMVHGQQVTLRYSAAVGATTIQVTMSGAGGVATAASAVYSGPDTGTALLLADKFSSVQGAS